MANDSRADSHDRSDPRARPYGDLLDLHRRHDEPVQRGDWIPLDPAQRRRFAERSASERVNARLKDHFGGRTVRVRGAAKVMCHLMFGLVAITALGLWQRVG